MIKFNIATINCCTMVEGPGRRLTIWFQGCNLHCKGCCNPSYQQLIPKYILTLDELLDIITKAKEKYNIEGVTYSGGEPTLQQNLPILTQHIKNLNLTVISFTGRLYEQVKDVLVGCDVVLDGAYVQALNNDNRKLLGSSNQRIICLTDKYRDNICTWFDSDNGKQVEININNFLTVNGDYI